MFIVWGTKVVRPKIGRMADYCPMCRSPGGFVVRAVQTVGHLYYIPLGSRQTHGHTKACEGCGLKMDLADGDMESVVCEPRASVDELIGWSSPSVSDRIARRTDLDRRAKSGALAPEARKGLIVESFAIAEPLLAQRTAQIHFDAFSTVAACSMVAIPILAAMSVPVAFSGDGPGFIAICVLVGLALVATIVLFATDGRRYARRKLLPMIVRSLLPLNPTRPELDAAFASLRESQLKVGKWLTPQRVEESLRTADAFRDPGLS